MQSQVAVIWEEEATVASFCTPLSIVPKHSSLDQRKLCYFHDCDGVGWDRGGRLTLSFPWIGGIGSLM